MKKIGEGDKSEVFELPDGRILKLFFPQHAGLAPTEAKIARILDAAGVRAPHLDEEREVDGRPGLVFSNLGVGKTVSDAVRKEPWKIVGVARELATLHATVHECTSDDLPSQREQISLEIETSDAVGPQIKDLALRLLDELPDGNVVCHNDIHMLNIIVLPVDSMIIDWTLSTRGNPLADVATAVLQLRFGEQPQGLIARSALEIGRAIFWRTYLSRYLHIRPDTNGELEQWELPIAVALAGRRAGRMRRQLLHRIDGLLTTSEIQPADLRA